jgi:hypothetical protein
MLLEAIRPELAELNGRDNKGTGVRGDPELLSIVTPATEEELALEAELVDTESPLLPLRSSDTVRIDDHRQLASPYANDPPPDLNFPSPNRQPWSTPHYPLFLPLSSTHAAPCVEVSAGYALLELYLD